MTGDATILCACGCGLPVRRANFPSRQSRYINTHQHRGTHNGNFRGGKIQKSCPVCLDTFAGWPSQHEVTCGKDKCYRKWLGMKTAARGRHKVIVQCAMCGKDIHRFPSQVKERNFCDRSCHSRTKGHTNNGNWKGGLWKWVQRQILNRDDHKCVVCGFNLVVDIHHIVRRKSGGKDTHDNLVTLCPNHHRMADLRLIGQDYLRQFATPTSEDRDRANRSRSES